MNSKQSLIVVVSVLTFVILFTLVILCLAGRFFYCEHYGPAVPLQKPLRLYMHSAETHRNTEEALSRVSKTLRDNDLDHWPVAGTLIGCMRHQGPIPWDDDVDLGILDEQFDEVGRVLKKKFGKKMKVYKGLSHPMFRMWKLKFKDLPKTYVDLFSFKRNKGKVRMAGNANSWLYSGEVTPAEWMFPLRKNALRFGQVLLDGPAYPERTCEFFAPGYMNMYIVHPRHSAYKKPWNMFMRKRYIDADQVVL